MTEPLLYRPPAERPETPEGWEQGPPDFVGVGAIRAGTSWWHYLINGHPDVASVPGRSKELHFFDHFGDPATTTDPYDYHGYFPRPAGSTAGEWTPRYMFDAWTPPLLAKVAPEARLLVLLRDPVARMSSALTYIRQMGFVIDEAAVGREFVRSLYWHQLDRLTRYFRRDRILVLQYEKCAVSMPGELSRTFLFLGLDPARMPLRKRHFRSRNETTTEKIPVDTTVGDSVRDQFREQMRKLAEDYPEIDQSLWPSARL
jgi:hypothetical protein